MPKKNKKEEEEQGLTEEQKQIILDTWNSAPKDAPLLIKNFMQALYGPGVDGRDKRVRVVKRFLASREIEAKSTFGYTPMKLELTSEQKEYLTNNINQMTPMEMTRILFSSNTISALDKRFLIVNEFCGSLHGVVKYKPANEVQSGKYRPPKDYTQAANKVNQYIKKGIDVKEVSKDRRLQECLTGLIKFCHSHHFMLTMDNFQSLTDKNLFEGRFISYVWDKPDLSEEELDAYILLCNNIVSHAQLQRQKDGMSLMLENQMDEKDGKVYMGLVEALKDINKSINDNEKRQDNLRKELTGMRSSRIDIKVKENQSMIQFVEAWREKEKRDVIIKLAERRKMAVRKEIDKQENFEEVVSQIFNLDKTSFE